MASKAKRMWQDARDAERMARDYAKEGITDVAAEYRREAAQRKAAAITQARFELADHLSDSDICQDDYEYMTGTGRYAA